MSCELNCISVDVAKSLWMYNQILLDVAKSLVTQETRAVQCR